MGEERHRQQAIAVGAVLAAGAFLLPRLHAHTTSAGLVVAIVFVIGFGAGLALDRSGRSTDAVFGLEHDVVLVRRFAGLVLCCATFTLGSAAYVDPPAALLPIAAAAIAVGWVFRPVLIVLVQASGPRPIARDVLVGAVISVLGPPLLSAIAGYVATRIWIFDLASTTDGMRFVALLACGVAAVGATSLAGQADTDLVEDDPFADHVADHVGDAADAADGGTASATTTASPLVGPAAGGGPLLEVDRIDVRYGKVQVLFGATLHVDDGEALALLGTNGAGKSTVLRAAFGLKEPSAGRVIFDGEDITGRPAEELVHLGMIQVPGGKGIFPSLTVADNLRMAGYLHKEESRAAEGIERTLAMFPRLRERIDQPAGLLSGGEQQMLALGRAWIARPRLLAIDELTLGLAPVVVEELKAVVRDLQAEGVTLILVEQSVQVALDLTERACFLERGRVRFDGRTADLAGRNDLLRSIFFAGATGDDA